MNFEVLPPGNYVSAETHDRICSEMQSEIKRLIVENETLRHRALHVERKIHALNIIRHWAGNPGQLDPKHVREMCDKALKGEG